MSLLVWETKEEPHWWGGVGGSLFMIRVTTAAHTPSRARPLGIHNACVSHLVSCSEAARVQRQPRAQISPQGWHELLRLRCQSRCPSACALQPGVTSMRQPGQALPENNDTPPPDKWNHIFQNGYTVMFWECFKLTWIRLRFQTFFQLFWNLNHQVFVASKSFYYHILQHIEAISLRGFMTGFPLLVSPNTFHQVREARTYLHRDVQSGHVEGFKHDLSQILSVLRGVQGRLCLRHTHTHIQKCVCS